MLKMLLWEIECAKNFQVSHFRNSNLFTFYESDCHKNVFAVFAHFAQLNFVIFPEIVGFSNRLISRKSFKKNSNQ